MAIELANKNFQNIVNYIGNDDFIKIIGNLISKE